MTPPARSAADAALTQHLRDGAAQVLVRDSFSRQQVAVRHLACEDRQCRLELQIPPFAEASVRHDLKVTSDLFDAFREIYAQQGAQVALTEVSESDEGMRLALHVDAAPRQGRLMTDTDIAKIRAETLRDYLAHQAGQARAAQQDSHAK